jgi:hypothetical protein
VVTQSGKVPVAVLRPVGEDFRPRLLSESIALAKNHAEELGYEPTLDPDFAADLEQIIKSRKPREISHGNNPRYQRTQRRETPGRSG